MQAKSAWLGFVSAAAIEIAWLLFLVWLAFRPLA
jgi:hypothetical protein